MKPISCLLRGTVGLILASASLSASLPENWIADLSRAGVVSLATIRHLLFVVLIVYAFVEFYLFGQCVGVTDKVGPDCD